MKTLIALGFLALEALSAQPQQTGTITQNTGGVCSQAVVAATLGKTWVDPYPCPYHESNGWQYTLKNAHSIWNL